MDHETLQQAEAGIGQRIKELRLDCSLTQEDLAALADTDQAVIQKIEKGKSIRPRNLPELVVALKVYPAWLRWCEPYAKKQLETSH